MPLTKRQRQILDYCKTTQPDEPPSHYKVDSVRNNSYLKLGWKWILDRENMPKLLKFLHKLRKAPEYNYNSDSAALRDLEKQGYISFRDGSSTAFRLETLAYDEAEIERIRLWEKIKDQLPGFLFGVLGTAIGLLLSKLF